MITETTPLDTLICRWRGNPGATYRSWFLWEARLNNFHSIRRCLQTVVGETEAGAFGTHYRSASEAIARTLP